MKFGFCLISVNAHDFLHCMDQIRYFNTERRTVGIIFEMEQEYWKKMIKNSIADNLLPPSIFGEFKSNMIYTKGGKPLLQVCIENEVNENG